MGQAQASGPIEYVEQIEFFGQVGQVSLSGWVTS